MLFFKEVKLSENMQQYIFMTLFLLWQEMKTLAKRRRSNPSLILDKTIQKQPRTKKSHASVDTCAFLSSCMCSDRILLIDGRVELKRSLQRQERHIFLFSDLFVVAKVKYTNSFKIKNKVKLSDMWTASCVDEVGDSSTDAMKSFVLGWPTVNFVATFSSPEQKDKWFSLLQRYIDLEKEKDYPKSIPLKIFTKDIGNCAYSKTITIMNTNTANDVINISLQMLRITGSDRDYQLWVKSGKEKSPYPLIGHEYPYGIKMSHLRDTALLTQLSKDAASHSSLREFFLIDQLPREMQCQFILKHSCLAVAQHLSDSGQKTCKRRRSVINWPLRQSSSTQPDNVPVSPVSPLPGQLFGVSLPNICENDDLPKPILDILSVLNQRGPLTDGIFRLSGSMKSCRELKEKLNSGVDVQVDCEHILVIASVLKDFLRNIPGSILSSALFDQWIGVMEQENDEEKISRVQRLLDQLPRAHVVLLRYLFGVLHNIEQHSSSNQMTAYNLAVCVAPSMLWPPTTSSPEVENEFAKKVPRLFQFVIENCCSIFGEEITSLFRGNSVTHGTQENASGHSCFPMSNSSCDNLDNELNEDVDAPCSDLVKKLGQESRSMDFVLTLNSNDLDQPEVEGLLTLNDFDSSKHVDIQTQQPLEYALGTLQEHAGPLCGKSTPDYLCTPAAEAPKSPRQPQHFSEPRTGYLDSKLSFLRQFYQKKVFKSHCNTVLSRNDGDYMKQTQPQQEEDSGQKTCKRRRSIITWPLRQSSSNQLDNVPMSPVSPLSGQLFGVSLPSICENDDLPKPILDTLSVLNQRGPLTDGIFRLSGSMKSCRELKEKLNSGVDMQLDCEHVLVIASVLKDFLRNIPGSILSSALFDQWVSVMEQENDEEKISRFQRLLDQLPRANVVLLRYLFGVLHNIEQHSSSNQMTAYNLAVCVAPSILWPPTTSSLEVENEFAKKVPRLFQFVIENCCRVFGEEITSLFREDSVTHDTRENASGHSYFPMSNSSCDSLDNELSEDVEAPCSDRVKKLGQESRSMDFVLTLNSNDLDQPEVEGLLTLNDFDSSKHVDIQTQQPLEYAPGTSTDLCRKATLQEHAGPLCGISTPDYLSTPAAEAPKSPRQPQHFSEPSSGYLDSKLSHLRQFYQKKLRKSRCNTVLSGSDGDYLKPTHPQQEEGKASFSQSLVTGTDGKKDAVTENVIKKNVSGIKGNHMKLPLKSKPVAIPMTSYKDTISSDHPQNQSFVSDISRSSPRHLAASRASRRQRHLSESSIADQSCRLGCLSGLFPKKQQKASLEASHLHGVEDYRGQHKSSQMGGQQLINQNSVGVKVGTSSATNQNTQRLLPSTLDICLSTSSSSLSSLGTCPSVSSGCFQDSACLAISELSVFTPTETSSPIDHTFQAPIKQEELPSDFCSSTFITKMAGPSSGQAVSHLADTEKDPGNVPSVILPSTWLRNGLAHLKNWKLKNKVRASKSEKKNVGSQRGPTESPPQPSGVLEGNSVQEQQKDIPLRPAERLGAVLTAQWCSSDLSQDAEKHCSSPFILVRDRLEPCVNSCKEEEDTAPHSPGTLSCSMSSISSWTMDNVTSPDSVSSVVCDVGHIHSTKDISPQ